MVGATSSPESRAELTYDSESIISRAACPNGYSEIFSLTSILHSHLLDATTNAKIP